MLRVVNCLICGDSHIGFGKTCVTVKFATTKRTCDNCNSTNTEEHAEFVCSLECFQEYCKRKINRPFNKEPV
jgi:hypothetical protein